MNLEDFALDMSPEWCHMMTGVFMGWSVLLKVLALLLVYKFISYFAEDTGKYIWIKIKEHYKKK